MRYRIILTARTVEQLRNHLLTDRSKEQMAVTLCGVNRLRNEVRFLARHVLLLPPEAFLQQSSAYLEVLPKIQSQILRLAAAEGLSQIDWHSHPGETPFVGFSGIDDHNETKLALYLNEKMAGTYYGSVVVNRSSFDARIWLVEAQNASPRPVDSIRFGDFNDMQPNSLTREYPKAEERSDERFSRQVLAFGHGLQERLRECRIGIIGVGGLGGIVVEMLARLGASDWVLVDDDVVETTNLNRLPGSSPRDAYFRTLKVNLARNNIVKVNPFATVRALPFAVSDPRTLQGLKSCDLLIVATDNHSSRLIANRLSVQYLIPLIHTGVNIDVDEEKKITDMSGEYAFPSLGEWCLQCAGIIDNQSAGWEMADETLRSTLRERGYIKDTPAPAVYHLNGLIASLTVAEIHNFIFPYKTARRYLTYDELKAEVMPLEVGHIDHCPVCGTEGGYLGLGDLEPLPDYEAKANGRLPVPGQFNLEEPEKQANPPDSQTAPYPPLPLSSRVP